MIVQAVLLFVMWVVADDSELVFSALRIANFTALGLHVATIAKIIQNEFSYYHSAMAVQISFLTIISLVCAVGHPGWRQFSWTTCAFCIFNSLTLMGECIYLLVSLAQARVLAESCSPQKFIQFDQGYWTEEMWRYPVSIIALTTAVLFADFLSLDVRAWIVPLAIAFGTVSITSQTNMVGYFKPYMDSAEEQWGFGQIFAMAGLAVPLYELYRFGREHAPRQPTPWSIPLRYELYGYTGEHSPRQPIQPTPRFLLWKDKCIFPLDTAKLTKFSDVCSQESLRPSYLFMCGFVYPR
jgi:hypothetical protein